MTSPTIRKGSDTVTWHPLKSNTPNYTQNYRCSQGRLVLLVLSGLQSLVGLCLQLLTMPQLCGSCLLRQLGGLQPGIGHQNAFQVDTAKDSNMERRDSNIPTNYDKAGACLVTDQSIHDKSLKLHFLQSRSLSLKLAKVFFISLADSFVLFCFSCTSSSTTSSFSSPS